jgi:hypothetical protein
MARPHDIWRESDELKRFLPQPPPPSDSEILGQFLIHTLIERLAFHECGGVAFHALRRWRAEIKAYQIEGLFALKRNPSAAIRAYRAASERWHPIIEQVDARVFWPKIGHVRERYQRLILPISKADSRFLVCIADSTKPPWAPFA